MNDSHKKSGKQDHHQEDVIISLSDLWGICRKFRKKIVFGSLFVALLTGLYALLSPISYEVKASFREKGKNNSSKQGLNLSSLITGNVSSNSNNEAVTLLKSRTLMEHLVSELGLQATLEPKKLKFKRLENVQNNLLAEYALFSNKKTPSLQEIPSDLEIINMTYTNEIPLHLSLEFLSSDTFEITAPQNKEFVPITGSVNVPLSTPHFSFTVARKKLHPMPEKSYSLTISPLNEAAINLSKNFTIVSDKNDKNLILLTYIHNNRHLAAKTLNTLMDCYRKYMNAEQEYLQNQQLDYLHSRQDVMENKLKQVMENYAATLACDVSCTGFPDSNSAVAFLARTQQKYKEHLLNIDLELQHLQSSVEEGGQEYRSYPANNASHIINQILGQIRQLKQKANSTELALLEASEKQQHSSSTHFSKQLITLQEIQQLSKEAKLASKSIEDISNLDRTSKLYNDHKYMVKYWTDKLQANGEDRETSEADKTNFSTYLANLIHLLQVHEKGLQERLNHQHNHKDEFQGIDLDIAKHLYIACSKELDDSEAQMLQHQCIADQLSDPNFEISSLSTLLKDPVSQSMILKGSELALSLQDQQNRSEKEHSRLKEALSVQKGFLDLHLKQTIALLNVKKKMVQEKMHSLQNTSLSLIRQEISVLQESLRDYIHTRIAGLKQEQRIIEHHQTDLQQEMNTLPHKWVTEKLIDQQMDVNKQIVEQVAKLVESKNIESNLELMQSVPLDIAFAPLHPKPPRILLFSLLGALLGAFMTSGFVIIRSLAQGLPVSLESLQFNQQHVSGKLSLSYCKPHSIAKPLLDEDLATLRRLVAFLDPESPQLSKHGQGRSLLLALGQSRDYSRDLASIMSRMGLKVLLLPLSFDRICEAEDLPGLLQYLEKKSSEPKIQHLPEFDSLVAGGVSRFANELIKSHHFQHLLEDLQKRYDWIIAISHAKPSSAEIESILPLFNCAALSVTDEKLKELHPCIALAKTLDPQRKMTFVIASCIETDVNI